MRKTITLLSLLLLLFAHPVMAQEQPTEPFRFQGVLEPVEGYQLGPRDVLSLHVWGKDVLVSSSITVNLEGYIFLKEIGDIFVWNLSIQALKSQLKQAFERRVGSPIQISLLLEQPRPIKIYISGFVQKPGVYTVGSLTRMVEALALAGGILSGGSQRNIQLIRQNKALYRLDLLDYKNRTIPEKTQREFTERLINEKYELERRKLEQQMRKHMPIDP